MSYMQNLGIRAKKSATILSQLKETEKNNILLNIATQLENSAEQIILANDLDIAIAKQNGMSAAMLDRLCLNNERIKNIADSVRFVASLNDPVGKIIDGDTRPNGLVIEKITVPLGVVGVIFESRPNVTVDCAALCIKSGNVCILRGGKEAINSNTALVNIMRSVLAQQNMEDFVLLVEDTCREIATEMMQLTKYIDVLIPRGGAGLIESVVQNAKIPIIETGVGNCHAFVDFSADFNMAIDIVENAKTTRPSVCNSLEKLLIHKDIAKELLPKIQSRLNLSNVEIRGCQKTKNILGNSIILADEDDWFTEYSAYIIAIKVVDNIEQAIEHIAKYSTHHSEVIITNSLSNSRKFTNEVDSAAVYVNASTRFTDGGEFGLGAEIGISTQKLHARGPMGLTELVSYKYIINGSGQIRGTEQNLNASQKK